MGDERPLGHLWIVGAGRVGLALGLLLERSGTVRALSYGGRAPSPPSHPLFDGDPPPARYRPGLSLPEGSDAVLIAVPDAAVATVARSLARLPLPPGVPVLHTSGALSSEALEPLARSGHPVASLHPLTAVADPVEGADRLRGAWFALEGDAAARAVGERIASAAGGRLLALRPGSKALYHAAAVFASNYVVALLSVAERLLEQAGAEGAPARDALAELAAGSVANVAAAGPAAGLTGPITRGDSATVARHLAELSPPDRALYSVLARETLALARRRGLAPDAAARLDRLLGGDA